MSYQSRLITYATNFSVTFQHYSYIHACNSDNPINWLKNPTVYLPASTIEGGNKTRESLNSGLVRRVLQSRARHRNATRLMSLYGTNTTLGMYSAVQCVSTDQLDKRSESSKSFSLPPMSVATLPCWNYLRAGLIFKQALVSGIYSRAGKGNTVSVGTYCLQ